VDCDICTRPKEALVPHRNAPLTETGRLRLARCIVEDRWPLRRAAERFQVAVTTAARWADRYREHGQAGMADRSSRPHHSPRQTPTRRERRIIKVRVLRRWGPARIGYLLNIAPSTVHRVLARYGLARLAHLDRATALPVRRYEHPAPGDLVHVDIKKLGNIPDGGGHRTLGRAAGRRNSGNRGHGYAYLHTPWTTTPDWPTPRSTPTNAATPPPRSGPALRRSSPTRGSPSRGS
jgi:transposase